MPCEAHPSSRTLPGSSHASSTPSLPTKSRTTVRKDCMAAAQPCPQSQPWRVAATSLPRTPLQPVACLTQKFPDGGCTSN